jgi:dihydrofolate synthase/folylpolyglutamate synthase
VGFPVSLAAQKLGFRKVVWPGRLEKVAARPAVFLDGAHNPAAVLALVEELRSLKAPIALVMGVMADKDFAAMVRLLAPGVHSVWTVRPPDARGLAAETLAECFSAYGIKAFPNAQLSRALAGALHAAGTQGTVVVGGSLYLLAPARRYLKKRGKRLTAPE